MANDKALAFLQHALGADQYGRICRGGGRSYFVTGEGSTDWPTCIELTERGLMKRYPPSAISGGDDIFIVTRAGQDYMHAESPKPPAEPKRTRSQKRYLAWLDEDCDLTFGEWIKSGYWRSA